MIWTDLAFGPRYISLNLHVIGLESSKNEFGLQFKKNFLVGPQFRLQIGPKFGRAKWGPTRQVWAPHKKTCLLYGLDSGNRSWPMGRVQV